MGRFWTRMAVWIPPDREVLDAHGGVLGSSGIPEQLLPREIPADNATSADKKDLANRENRIALT
jgi:hypothetical protein